MIVGRKAQMILPTIRKRALPFDRANIMNLMFKTRICVSKSHKTRNCVFKWMNFAVVDYHSFDPVEALPTGQTEINTTMKFGVTSQSTRVKSRTIVKFLRKLCSIPAPQPGEVPQAGECDLPVASVTVEYKGEKHWSTLFTLQIDPRELLRALDDIMERKARHGVLFVPSRHGHLNVDEDGDVELIDLADVEGGGAPQLGYVVQGTAVDSTTLARRAAAAPREPEPEPSALLPRSPESPTEDGEEGSDGPNLTPTRSRAQTPDLASGSRQRSVAPAPAPASDGGLRTWLRKNNLGEYASAVATCYPDLDSLLYAGQREVEQMSISIGMKRPHMQTLKQARSGHTRASSTQFNLRSPYLPRNKFACTNPPQLDPDELLLMCRIMSSVGGPSTRVTREVITPTPTRRRAR